MQVFWTDLVASHWAWVSDTRNLTTKMSFEKRPSVLAITYVAASKSINQRIVTTGDESCVDRRGQLSLSDYKSMISSN
jgi:hypothetical protein